MQQAQDQQKIKKQIDGVWLKKKLEAFKMGAHAIQKINPEQIKKLGMDSEKLLQLLGVGCKIAKFIGPIAMVASFSVGMILETNEMNLLKEQIQKMQDVLSNQIENGFLNVQKAIYQLSIFMDLNEIEQKINASWEKMIEKKNCKVDLQK